MNKLIYTLLFVITVFTSCHKLGIEKGAPTCLQNKIKTFTKTTCDKGAKVEEYLFQTRKVYAFNPGICGADMTTEVVDSECKTLGHLGGIIGNTKINGDDFSNATLVKVIWKK